jgi:nicotinamide mononucleotide transporter
MFLDHTFVTIAGYEMSYLEFVGTLLNLLSVWFVVRRNVVTWPVGIAGSVLFAVLFFDIRLYSDLLAQIYFVITGFYGWLVWVRAPQRVAAESAVTWLSRRGIVVTFAIAMVGTAAMGTVMAHLVRILPALFDEPAAYPYVDAFQTILSFIAQILMAHRKLENWVLWILVDVVSIGLYVATGVMFVAGLYVVFLVLAIRGLIEWLAVAEPRQNALTTLAVGAVE